MSNSTIIPLFIVIDDHTGSFVQVDKIAGVEETESGGHSIIHLYGISHPMHSPLPVSKILARIRCEIDEVKWMIK